MSDMLERVARAIDPRVWENWDNWVGLKGYNDAEKAEEFARSKSLHESLDRAAAAIEAYESAASLSPTKAEIMAGYDAAIDALRRA